MESYKPLKISTKFVYKNQNFDPEKHALDEGRENRPSSSDTELDVGQTVLLNHFGDLHSKEQDNVVEHISTIKNNVTLGLDIGLDLNYDALINKLKVHLASVKAREEHTFLNIVENMLEQLRNLKHFKKTNKIIKLAEYPKSKIFHYSVISAIILLESLANSSLFAQGNDLGLLGGWWQACLVSLANVGSALLFGSTILPHYNHVQIIHKILSTLGLIIFWLASITFNLAAAHYRDLLAKEINPLYHSIQKLLEDPFNISFTGFLLLIVGLVAAILAFIKGYESDDPYPGYGKVDRRYKEEKHQFDEFNTTETNKIRDITLKIINESSDNVRKGKEELNKLKNSRENAKNALSKFDKRTELLNGMLKESIKKYREDNSAVRTDPPPNYFTEFPNPFQNSLETDGNMLNFINDRANLLNNAVSSLENRIDEFRDHALKIMQEEIQSMNERFDELYKNAKKNVSAR